VWIAVYGCRTAKDEGRESQELHDRTKMITLFNSITIQLVTNSIWKTDLCGSLVPLISGNVICGFESNTADVQSILLQCATG
jgi:hypothetical protein